jgi:predicted Zn-ribbon and HTH transcriptional regulator
MAILPKTIYVFNAIPIKISTQFFIDLERRISKFIWNNKKKSRIANLFSTIKELLQESDLKLYYRAIVIKNCMYWYSDRQVDQWNRIEDPEKKKKPHTYGHLIFELKPSSGGKKDSIFNKWCWLNCRLACRRRKINPFLSPCTKLKSKWIKDFHIKADTLKLIEEKVEKNLEHMGTGGNS